jgi:hypothetical protein
MGRTAHCAGRASQEDCLPAEPWRCGSGLLPWEARLSVDSLGTLSAQRASFFAFWVLAHLLLNYDAGRGLPSRGPAGGGLLRCPRLACPRLRLPCFCLGLRCRFGFPASASDSGVASASASASTFGGLRSSCAGYSPAALDVFVCPRLGARDRAAGGSAAIGAGIGLAIGSRMRRILRVSGNALAGITGRVVRLFARAAARRQSL